MQRSLDNPIPDVAFAFDNSYARLPERFYAKLAPTAVTKPRLVKLNVPLARQLGLDPIWLASPEGVETLGGNKVPHGAEPLAMAYAGHQFGSWVPQLGDGRAILLGELRDVNGVRRDIQLKGAGPTPFSRNGDGRAALGPVLREYVVSEAMFALGIPTTRSLAVVTTGEHVLRQDGLLPGAVLTRVAQSHVRIGTFEYFGNRGDGEGVRHLADYVIERLYPEIPLDENRYRALLEGVIVRTAELVARWQLIGFIHGVMNTDNMAISGETIDYGPCAFMDTFNPAQVFSSIDAGGRYAYGNQPRIAHWNLVRLAQALLPLLGKDEEQALASARAAIDVFPARFEAALFSGLLRKIGVAEMKDGDIALAGDLLERMAANKVDFTLLFRLLCDAAERGDEADKPIRALFENPLAFDEWVANWRKRLTETPQTPVERAALMRRNNPAFIPRNHRIEAVIAAAQRHDDFTPLEELLSVLKSPYDDQPEFAHYADAPGPDEIVTQTFCGT
jgi:serine/tyrosine/threonine adenylyltransferase